MRKEGGRNRVGISTHSPEANACQQPSEAEGSWQTQRKIGRRLRGARGAGRCRGRLVRDSGEPGELAYETGQRLRGAKGATWLERFASLKAGAVCAWIEGRNRVW